MAWEWAGYVTTGVVGVAGIWGTLHGTTRQIDAQREQARDERQEKRLEASYYEMLAKVGEADDWTYRLLLGWGAKSEEPFVVRPDIFVKTIGALGVLSVHWSNRIRELIEELREHIDTAYKAWLRNQLAIENRQNGQDDDADMVALYERFTTAKDAISALTHTIRDQVDAELTNRHDGHAEA